MSDLSKHIKVILSRVFIGAPLTVGALTTVGILSFAGMYALSPSLVLSGFSAAFAVIIEGEVYSQNICSALNKLFQKRSFIENKVLERELKKTAKCSRPSVANDFTKLNRYICELEHNHHGISKKLAQKRIAQAKRQKEAILEAFRQYIYTDTASSETNLSRKNLADDFTNSLNQRYQQPELTFNAINFRKSIRQEITRKTWCLRAAVPVALLGGIQCGLVTTSQLFSHLPWIVSSIAPSIALSSTALAGIAWPLGIIAGIAYTFMIYKTLSDIIANDKAQKLFSKVKDYMIHKPWYKKILAVLGITGLSLTVLGATICTAGTWWSVVANSGAIFQGLATGAQWISWGLTPFAFLSQLVFFGDNVHESAREIKKIPEIIKANWSELRHKLSDESWGQILDPFRWIAAAVEFLWISLVFMCHIASIGVTGDRFPYIPSLLTAAVGTTNEALVDLHYIAEKGMDDHHHHHHDHDHTHYFLDNIARAIKLLVSPVIICSGVWQYAAAHENRSHISFWDTAKRPFWQRQRQAFGLNGDNHEEQAPETPVLTEAWQRYDCDQRLEQAHKQSRQDEQIDSIRSLRQQINDNRGDKQLSRALEELNLINQSSANCQKQSCSERILNEINDDYPSLKI